MRDTYWHYYDAEAARIIFGDISERSYALWVEEALQHIEVDGELFRIALDTPHYVVMPVRLGLKAGLRVLEDAMLEPGDING